MDIIVQFSSKPNCSDPPITTAKFRQISAVRSENKNRSGGQKQASKIISNQTKSNLGISGSTKKSPSPSQTKMSEPPLLTNQKSALPVHGKTMYHPASHGTCHPASYGATLNHPASHGTTVNHPTSAVPMIQGYLINPWWSGVPTVQYGTSSLIHGIPPLVPSCISPALHKLTPMQYNISPTPNVGFPVPQCVSFVPENNMRYNPPFGHYVVAGSSSRYLNF